MFNAALRNNNIDRIADFAVGSDLVHLDDAVFAGLTLATLAGTAFRANLTGPAEGSADRVIYDSTIGALYVDADGNGTQAAQRFAILGR